MANGEEKGNDFYAVMGLDKECTESELRNAYKKLAMKWHPDRCSASGNSKFVDEAKKKFQAIQQAYSVLSDANKRFLYDIGAYDSDDDDNGMGDFLNEMATMMSQTKPNENGGESFEELQQLFEDMFQSDIGISASDSHSVASCSTSSTYVTFSSETSGSNKRNSSEMNAGKVVDSCANFEATFQDFCLGVDRLRGIRTGGDGGVQQQRRGTGGSKRRHGRKQKVASGHDVSSNDFSSISAQ